MIYEMTTSLALARLGFGFGFPRPALPISVPIPEKGILTYVIKYGIP